MTHDECVDELYAQLEDSDNETELRMILDDVEVRRRLEMTDVSYQDGIIVVKLERA